MSEISSSEAKVPYVGQKERTPATFCQGVINQGAHFAGSFASNQRDTTDESVLPIPREKLTTKTLLKPLTKNWTDRSIWASAFIEGVGTMGISYMSALIHNTIGNFDTVFTPGWVGITNIFLLGLFIHACAPSSGGHLNPLITFSTLLVGLTGFSRAVLYMIAQTAGAAVAGGMFRASFGNAAFTKYDGGGCTLEPGSFPQGQAFIIEMMASFILLFLAFGNSLDPRQSKLAGPLLAPFLVGCIIGLISFSTSGLAVGYSGAGLNPARCFAMGVGSGNFSTQWIWWFGPLAGSVLATAVYRLVPPYHASK